MFFLIKIILYYIIVAEIMIIKFQTYRNNQIHLNKTNFPTFGIRRMESSSTQLSTPFNNFVDYSSRAYHRHWKLGSRFRSDPWEEHRQNRISQNKNVVSHRGSPFPYIKDNRIDNKKYICYTTFVYRLKQIIFIWLWNLTTFDSV